jgi:hypothetical protein
METTWIDQKQIEDFALSQGLKICRVNALAQVMFERLFDHGLCVRRNEQQVNGKSLMVFKIETQSFLELDIDGLPKVKEIGPNRLVFLKKYQAWLRQASALE